MLFNLPDIQLFNIFIIAISIITLFVWKHENTYTKTLSSLSVLSRPAAEKE